MTDHSDSTGFSTDSLLNAGYPHAEDLGEAVCGLLAVKFSDKDFLMWSVQSSAVQLSAV